jgi:Rrf2 family protein
MKLQKSTVIALYAVLELAAEPERQLSAGDIAARYDISTHHLAKVMRTLVREGLVQSVRGARGGYRFAGNANRVTLLDVIAVFEELGSDFEIAGGEVSPPSEMGRALQAVRDEIDDLTQATLQSITLATLIRNVDRLAARRRATEEDAAERAEPGPQ